VKRGTLKEASELSLVYDLSLEGSFSARNLGGVRVPKGASNRNPLAGDR
jgi:hypothetical protein